MARYAMNWCNISNVIIFYLSSYFPISNKYTEYHDIIIVLTQYCIIVLIGYRKITFILCVLSCILKYCIV